VIFEVTARSVIIEILRGRGARAQLKSEGAVCRWVEGYLSFAFSFGSFSFGETKENERHVVRTMRKVLYFRAKPLLPDLELLCTDQ
jgi:hypothetical protein